MRAENLPRLSGTKVKTKNVDYIHLYFLLNDLEAAIKKYANGHMLDLGCGNKPYENWYKQVTTSSVGCDIIQSDQNRVDVICLATELNFPDNTFDSVLCTQVLEHVFENQQLVKEAYRVLKPGGTIILTVPFCWQLHEEPYDFFRITKYGLANLFTEAGFEIDHIKANGGKWAATFQMLNNTVHSTFKYKTFRAKILKIFFVELRGTWLINKLAIWLDKRYFDESWTLNYLIIAKKP
ncbi:MAG: class I SAM-dependent methyltransferase [Ferruginibacter sp.]